MVFIKVRKSKAYFKRFQTKYRRRRECKTDYHARRKLVTQDKNKYNTPKYRFIVRLTNTAVICQLAYSKIAGDVIVSAAYSTELPRYGMPVGLSNYSAAYATGLLLARRTLTKFKLADKYKGTEDVTKTEYNDDGYFVAPELEDGPNTFKAILDVGLRRTTTGSRIFAALKGAVDGGLNIPHKPTRFVGYSKEEKKLNNDVLKKHITGHHIAEYMKSLQTDDKESYQKQFAKYIKAGIKADDLPKLWDKTFKAIRADPTHKKVEHKPYDKKPKRKPRLSLAQRKDRVRQKMAARARKAADN